MKKLLTKIGFILMIVFGVSLVSYGQRTITGTVTEVGSNETLIGANVLVKGTTMGTITDIDGGYTVKANEGDILIFSYTGFTTQEVVVGSSNVINVSLAEGQALSEVVVIGYGSQSQKEITSSVVSVSAEDFNQGPISDPAQLLQGKVAGLQIYNRGGDPNRPSTIRMRGISTVGANVEPLVVIDGVIGASLGTVDPSDIATIDVLKDGSAAAIYGSRGSSGVIIVTTKKGSRDSAPLTYSGQIGVSSPVRSIKSLSGSEFVAAGGSNIGSETDWLDAVTRSGVTQVHNLSTSGGNGTTNYRISGNIRNVDGILKNSGFDQYNMRMNFGTKALDDKMSIDFNTSYTAKNQNFGFNEALRYAVIYNPTAPILGADSPFPFASDQFGGYFESLGLFDAFNPVSIIEQNKNVGKRKEFNYGLNLGYNLTDGLKLNARLAQQSVNNNDNEYYPTTAHFRGNATSPLRKGLANFYTDQSSFKLFETYATNTSELGSSVLTITGGYSYQQNNFNSTFLGIGDFPDNSIDWSDNIGVSQDLQNAGFINASSNASPDEKIIAFFGRANMTIDDGIFLNASVRREGSSKLGVDNQWGTFPAVGVGADLNKYLGTGFDLFKVRVGYGVTGSLPRLNGLGQEIRAITNEDNGGVSTSLLRAANPDLKWEEKGELNFGIEFAKGRFSGTVDLYNRDITDFILEREVDAAVFGASRRFENAGEFNTKGLEVAINYDLIESDNLSWNTGIVFSTYKTKLKEYVIPAETRANLGAPGQNGTNMIRVKEGNEIGEIWGPVFESVSDTGSPIFADVNGDGELVTGQDKALEDNVDFVVLGNGIPDFEMGWTNQLSVGGWNVNAFFRGAFGHSLVNTFRAFYEPRVSTQSSYNYITTEKAVEGLTDARFSSLYVEKADFFKLDNLTISRRINLNSLKSISNINVSLTGQNLFVITGYSGTDPEPSLVDYGTSDNGGVVDFNNPDVLSPGIDRRNNYFSARTVTLGLSFNF